MTMNEEAVLRAVWKNKGSAWRYVPLATEPPAWMVFDKLLQRFVADPDLTKIDPTERLPETTQ